MHAISRNPAPLSYFKRIQLGDVGYTRRGCFHLLFSASCSAEGKELGIDVPRTFKQLDVGRTFTTEPQPPGHLSTDTVREARDRPRASIYPCVRFVTSVSSPEPHTRSSLLEPGSSISFKLTGGQGAALLTKYPIRREDVQLGGTFKEYTKEHYDSLVAFARERGHPDDIRPFLVTGVDMTRDFAMMTYSKDDNDLTVEFTISAPGIASPWGAWRTPGAVYTNCGPQPDNGRVGTDSDGYNQCVFVRYYTVRKRLWIPRVIKAGAGPHNLGPGSPEPDGGSPLGAQPNSKSGSDAESSPFDGGGDGDGSEEDIVIHNTTAVHTLFAISAPFSLF